MALGSLLSHFRVMSHQEASPGRDRIVRLSETLYEMYEERSLAFFQKRDISGDDDRSSAVLAIPFLCIYC